MSFRLMNKFCFNNVSIKCSFSSQISLVLGSSKSCNVLAVLIDRNSIYGK